MSHDLPVLVVQGEAECPFTGERMRLAVRIQIDDQFLQDWRKASRVKVGDQDVSVPVSGGLQFEGHERIQAAQAYIQSAALGVDVALCCRVVAPEGDKKRLLLVGESPLSLYDAAIGHEPQVLRALLSVSSTDQIERAKYHAMKRRNVQGLRALHQAGVALAVPPLRPANGSAPGGGFYASERHKFGSSADVAFMEAVLREIALEAPVTGSVSKQRNRL